MEPGAERIGIRVIPVPALVEDARAELDGLVPRARRNCKQFLPVTMDSEDARPAGHVRRLVPHVVDWMRTTRSEAIL